MGEPGAKVVVGERRHIMTPFMEVVRGDLKDERVADSRRGDHSNFHSVYFDWKWITFPDRGSRGKAKGCLYIKFRIIN